MECLNAARALTVDREVRFEALVPLAVAAALLLLALFAGAMTSSAYGESTWTTYHRDPGRSGDDPEGVNPTTPTLSWQSPDLGAPIWGQPLILGSRVYVATVGDEIAALSVSTGKVIWKKKAGTPVPSADVLCGDITPTVGIVGTPVIDTATNAIYAVADTWDATTKEAHHVLKGYGLAHGESVLNTPVDPPGAEPKELLQRPALNLDKGEVIIGFGGNAGDCGTYRGTVAAAPETGGPPRFWQYSPAPPAFGGAAVWGASGPAVDGEGHVYVSTGNPNFPEGQEVTAYDYSDSVIELDAAMNQIGSFEPETWLADSNDDQDLGAAGPELLPGGLLFQAGKDGMGFLVDEATMGSSASAVYSQKVCGGHGSFGGDAYADGTIYVPCTDGVRALTYNQPTRSFTSLWSAPSEATGPPIVSAGLVWTVDNKFLEGGATKLYGLDASTGAEIYKETLPSPTIDHFTSPSAAGGRLFLATGSSVTAYQIAQLSAELPTITKLSPIEGPVSGAEKVTITGTNLEGATEVRFGAAEAETFTVKSRTSITAVSPVASAPGTVEVLVTTAAGKSAAVPADRFTYVKAPKVAVVKPHEGPTAGHTKVTITGTNLTGATEVKFGTTKVKSFNVVSATSITTESPAHAAAETVDVFVKNSGGTSKADADDHFTYVK
jgi:polyvinyl alcohol dehydrogenase (cytochrome)